MKSNVGHAQAGYVGVPQKRLKRKFIYKPPVWGLSVLRVARRRENEVGRL